MSLTPEVIGFLMFSFLIIISGISMVIAERVVHSAVFLLIAVNDRSLMAADRANGPWANLALGTTVIVAMLLGASAVWRAAARMVAGG